MGETDDHHPPQPPTAAGALLNMTAKYTKQLFKFCLKKKKKKVWETTDLKQSHGDI